MSKPPFKPPASNPSPQNPATEPPLAIALEWAPDFVARLIRDLPSIRDTRIRALALAERLQHLAADDIIVIAKRLHDASLKGDEAAIDIYACFRDAQALEQRLGTARMRALADAARKDGHEMAAMLVAPLETLHGGGTRTHKDLRELSLGERKALAKSHSKEMLIKLLEDDHPHVQQTLLTNPRLSAREVVAVAAKRPGLAHVLRGIARHPRWMHNYEVRRALAKNPDTPVDVAGRIVATLPRTDLKELAADNRLNPVLLRIAKQRLESLAQENVLVIEDEDS